MPRSFSFDHFTAQKPAVSRSLKNKAKQKVSGSEQDATSANSGLHYGKRYAKTEQLTRRKAEAREEANAEAAQRAPAAATSSSQVAEQRADAPRIEEPIDAGFVPALPKAELRQAPPPGSEDAPSERTVFDVLEDGREQLILLARSAVEVARAGLRLTQLSLELGWFAASLIRPRRPKRPQWGNPPVARFSGAGYVGAIREDDHADGEKF